MELYPEASQPPSFASATLLMPAVSVGNVGQLAIDLVVATLKPEFVGYLHEANVLPCSGHEPYDSASGGGPPGGLALGLELYHVPRFNLFVMQQRAPAATGRQREFAESTVAWVLRSGFAKVVLLGSLQASIRTEAELDGPLVQYVAHTPALQQQCEGLGLTPVQEDKMQRESPLLPPWPLVAVAGDRNVPLLALLAYVSEGDNAQEAVQLAGQAARALQLFDEGEGSKVSQGMEAVIGRWTIPKSWGAIYGRPVDSSIF